MKNRWNLLLTVLTILSVPLCFLAWIVDIRLLLFLPALPAFCLQILLCRKTRRYVLWAIPLLCVALFCLSGAWITQINPGLDGILGVIMMFASISPAVGCVLALAGWGLCRLYQRGSPHG